MTGLYPLNSAIFHVNSAVLHPPILRVPAEGNWQFGAIDPADSTIRTTGALKEGNRRQNNLVPVFLFDFVAHF